MKNAVPRERDEGVWDLNDVEEKVADSTQWGLVGAKAYKGYPRTQNTLPAGIYSITLDRNDERPIFIRRDVKTDDIKTLHESITRPMMEEIESFWSKGALFKSHGFLHRRGYLLYGPQGTGKTSVVKQIMVNVIKKGGLVLLCDNPKFLNMALVTLRQAEPERHLVCVFEDIDAIIAKYTDDELLSVLDGANMIDHVLNVATTNYPERLDRRIVSRPRRFDRVIKVDVPGEKMRREFLRKQLPKVSAKVIDEYVKKTEGLSIAALSEFIISVYCLGNKVGESIAVLRALNEGKPSSSDYETLKIGYVSDFGGGVDDDDKEGTSND